MDDKEKTPEQIEMIDQALREQLSQPRAREKHRPWDNFIVWSMYIAIMAFALYATFTTEP